ncbi:MAG: DinB family protein [Rhizobiaceae bacterium]
MRDHFKMFAAYNGWANRKVYTAAAKLSDSQWKQDCGVFFGSMMGTLNHILVGDMIWMKRLTGEGEVPNRLDVAPYEEYNTLLAARRAMDDRIIDFCKTVSEDRLAAEFTYARVTDPTPVTQPFAQALAHLFNHQTHHRGHAHAILTQLTGEAPSLDLIYYQREARQKQA